MSLMNCKICNYNDLKTLFTKTGKDQNVYFIVQCNNCGIVQTYPQPEDVYSLYKNDYFEKRTDRGYNNYLSQDLKNQLIYVWQLNLKDLGFFNYEKEIFKKNQNPRLLEIGCAAGYFLEYMKNRNWDVMGVEISKEMSDFAIKKLQLNVINQDFLKSTFNYNSYFDCVVLWASIEHFKDPLFAFKKIYDSLKSEGLFIFSTCRWGLLAKWQKEKWRFMNVPEHLFFFNEDQLTQILHRIGFKKISLITYGSGLTKKAKMSFSYRFAKNVLDKLVKITHNGDMLAMMFKKI